MQFIYHTNKLTQTYLLRREREYKNLWLDKRGGRARAEAAVDHVVAAIRAPRAATAVNVRRANGLFGDGF